MQQPLRAIVARVAQLGSVAGIRAVGMSIATAMIAACALPAGFIPTQAIRSQPIAPAASVGARVVDSDGGRLQGVQWLDAEAFFGIPYAAPPVGSLRWAAPRPPVGWSGVRAAAVPGANCPQKGGAPQVPRSENEDCLYLNLYRPAGTSADAALPVLFYAFGGANVSNSAIEFDGARMARETGVMVVVPNPRLGALGFLNHPALARQTADRQGGNFALGDLKAALAWVQRNARAFGGDPQKVTIAAQSSGATNTCRLLVEPSVRGWFRAAILSSEDCLHDADPPDVSSKEGLAVAKQLGCVADDNTDSSVAECLRGKSAGALIDVRAEWNPVAQTPAVDDIASGHWVRVPMLVGSNLHEGRYSGLPYRAMSAQQYADWIRRLTGKGADRVLARYPANRYSGTYAIPYVVGDVITDSGMRGLGGCTNLKLVHAAAAYSTVFMYQFEDDEAPSRAGPADYQSLASHGFETPYVWPDSIDMRRLTDRFTPQQRQLSDEMIRYWGSFVKNLDPATTSQAAWPRFQDGGQLLSLRSGGRSAATSEQVFRQSHQCDLWDSLPAVLDRG